MDTTVKRRWQLTWAGILAGAAVGIAGSAAALAATSTVYAATASVLVERIGSTEVSLVTEAQLARSTQTAADAAAAVGRGADDLAAATSVQPVPDSSVLLITVEGPSPERAQAGAHAVAAAYLANRAKAARAAIAEQVAALNTRIEQTAPQVAQLNTTIAKLPASSPALPALRNSLASMTAQLGSLTDRATELETTPIDAGRVIAEPQPGHAVRPQPWLYLTIATAAGALVGGLAVLVRQRLARRVRDGADLQRRGIGVLAHVLTQDRTGIAGSRAFNRLRNEVIAALGTNDRVILVTGASPGSASTLVATNLAAAFARADTEVVLVGANAPEVGTPPLSQLFDVADIPGLTDVLTGRVSLPGALQRAARLPRLRVVTPGGTASAAGLLQSEGARSAVHALRRQARYVVLEAPSTAAGADAQSLARVADAVILVVETGRTRHAQVADAAQQLHSIGTRLLGAVLISPPMPEPDRNDAPGLPAGAHDDWAGETPAIVDAPTTRLQQLPGGPPAAAPGAAAPGAPGAPDRSAAPWTAVGRGGQ